MNCEVARLLLEFRRKSESLSPSDVTSLAGHLSHCPACAAFAEEHARFDQLIGSVIRDVPVPPLMRDRLVNTACERIRREVRRWLVRRAVASLAALFLVGIAWGMHLRSRPAFDVEALVTATDRQESTEQAVSDWLASEGLPPTLPLDFDFRLHRFHGKERLHSVEVPSLLFEAQNERGRLEWARVYIVTSAQFNLRDVEKLKSAQGSLATALVVDDPIHPHVKYVILFSSPGIELFLKATARQVT